MAESPAAEEQRALCQIIVQFVATGPRERPAVEFVISRSIASNGTLKHISEQEILDDCRDGPETEGAVRSLFTRLRKDLAEFFAQHPVGRKQKHKLVFPRGTYAPRFEINDPPPMPGDLVKSFWSPYYASDKPIRVIYPEVSAAAEHGTAANVVPSGVVRALISLFDCFQRSPRVPVTAAPLGPGMPFPEQDEDIIVLGTPATMPHVSALEASCPIRTGADEVVVKPVDGGPEAYSDCARKSDAGGDNVHAVWTVLTRKPRRYQGRVMTLLAANNGTAIDAVASFLTRQRELDLLAQKLGMEHSFPDRFQALFEVVMVEGWPEPTVEQILPRRVFDLDNRA
jgi:hypothetical protein